MKYDHDYTALSDAAERKAKVYIGLIFLLLAIVSAIQ
jgi:hypothetical protein